MLYKSIMKKTLSLSLYIHNFKVLLTWIIDEIVILFDPICMRKAESWNCGWNRTVRSARLTWVAWSNQIFWRLVVIVISKVKKWILTQRSGHNMVMPSVLQILVQRQPTIMPTATMQDMPESKLTILWHKLEGRRINDHRGKK